MMDRWGKRIGIIAGVFLGVILVMALSAKVMMSKDTAKDDSYAEALDKLAGNSASDTEGPADLTNSSDGQNADLPGENVGDSDNKDAGNQDAENQDTDNKISEKTPLGDLAGDQSSDNKQDGDLQDTTLPDDKADNSANSDLNKNDDQTNNYVSGDSKKKVIVIDAAHQQTNMSEKEPIGPGSEKTKSKISTGATGVSSGTPEYKLVLDIALALKNELVSRGYTVEMVRESNNFEMSDADRAVWANSRGEIVIHIHANADEREGISGIMAFYPSAGNVYVSSLSAECKKLSAALLEGLKAETEAKNWGTIENDNLTALNWTKIPTAHIEIGYLSNPDEDKLMQTAEYRKKIVEGLADGIDLYYSE